MQSFTSDFKIITPSPFSSDSLPDSDPALLTELASQVHEVFVEYYTFHSLILSSSDLRG